MFLFKGWTPAFIRLGPNTVLLFVFFEVSVSLRLSATSLLTVLSVAATQEGLGFVQ